MAAQRAGLRHHDRCRVDRSFSLYLVGHIRKFLRRATRKLLAIRLNCVVGLQNMLSPKIEPLNRVQGDRSSSARPIAALIVMAIPLAPAPLLAKTLYVETGKLVDVAAGKILSGQCISVADDKITAVASCGPTPSGAERIDWSAYTVLPGLIDLHTHLADAGQSADLALPLKTSPAATALIGAHNARVTLEAGFTTVRDVGTYRGLTDVALKNAIECWPCARPAHVCGGGLYHHSQGRRRAERRGPERAAARRHAAGRQQHARRGTRQRPPSHRTTARISSR